jgi:two-component system, LytTR family, sensor kinase
VKSQTKFVIPLLHLLVWGCYVLLNYFLSLRLFPLNIALLRLFFVGLLNVAVYLFCYYYLVPKFFKLGHYFKLILFCVVITLASHFFRIMVEKNFAPFLIDKQILNAIPIYKILSIVPQGLLVLVASLLSVLKINFIKEQELVNLKILEANRELELIKAKINPHFLLNTLNNIYAINYEESPKTSEAIMQLSKVLSYTIYKSKNELIPVNEEIELLKSLIGLYQLKYDHQLNIQLTVDDKINDRSINIPSLIFFSLLENAFKHATLTIHNESYLKIKIFYNNKNLQFLIENSISSNIKSTKESYSSGLGVNVIKQILTKKYGNNFVFEIENNAHIYKVNIILPDA